MLVLYFCVTSYQKPSDLKQHTFTISVFVGQEFWHGLASSYAQGLPRLQLKCWMGCIPFWSLESTFKFTCLLAGFSFFVFVGLRSVVFLGCQPGAALSSWRPISLPGILWQCGSLLLQEPQKYLSLQKGFSSSFKDLLLIKSGLPKIISLLISS